MDYLLPTRERTLSDANRLLREKVLEIDDMFKFIEENIEDVKEAFAIYDKHGTGKIPTSCLVTILRSLGMNPTEDQVEDLTMEVDSDGNGFIDFIEFLQMMKKMWAHVDDTLREAFEIFDTDGSGTIDAGEIRGAVLTLGEETFSEDDIDALVAGLDVDGDGQIDLEEFVKVLAH